MAGYITPQILVDALSEPTYMAIFDDTNSGLRATVDASTGVVTCLALGHAETASFLPSILSATPAEQPSALVSRLLEMAEVSFCVCFAYRRHPEYVKTYGAEPSGPLYKECVARMLRIQAGTQQIPTNDNPPQKAANVGGSSVADGARIAMTGTDGVSRLGDF